MSISERYRALVEGVEEVLAALQAEPLEGSQKHVSLVAKALEGLDEFRESVGEIPQMHLENKLSPVLLRAHSDLDRSRLLLDERGEEDRAARIWELEQGIYRLLNSL